MAALVSLTMLAGLALSSAPGITSAAAETDSVSPALFRKGLEAEGGRVVRRHDRIKVTRVYVRHNGNRVGLYVVRVKGHFPPRALRYVVSAGGERIGYGVPVPTASAVETVTKNRAVLEERIRAVYPARRVRSEADGFRRVAGAGATVPDPAVAGAHAVAVRSYNLGEQVFQPTDIGSKVEIVGQVHHPTDLANGPYPLVLFLHGNHSTCFKGGDARFQWPCRGDFRPIPNHHGYSYIGQRLASHGFVVVSISANGVNALGSRLRDTAMRQRGELLDRHLELWEQWSTAPGGPFGDRFVGAVDMGVIGTMGHSRGGEGVVWHKTVDDERPDPFDIDAVIALAPVDFTRQEINNVPFSVMLPFCDGDVSDLQGVHFFDDSRYNVAGDVGPKHTVSFFGANHNFFNTVWSPSSRFPGASDDGNFASCQGERWNAAKQRRIGRSYIVGFFRRYLEPDLSLDAMWTGEAHPDFTGTDEVMVAYHAPDTPALRRDLVRFTDSADLVDNQLDGDMGPSGLARYEWCANTRAMACFNPENEFFDRHLPGLARGVLGWQNHDAVLGSRLPVGTRDVSGFETFQFRALVPPGYGVNRGIRYQDFSIALIDGAGDEAEVAASEVGNEALKAPRGFVPHFVAQQVRFPLDLFTGINMTDIREVQFRFDRMRTGVVQVSDAAFSNGGG